MRTLLLLVIGGCAIPHLPEPIELATTIRGLDADESGVYWATDDAIYANRSGEETTRIAPFSPPTWLDFVVAGDAIVWRARDEELVHVVPLDGAPPRTIAIGPIEKLVDGEHGAVWLESAAPFQLVRVDLATGERRAWDSGFPRNHIVAAETERFVLGTRSFEHLDLANTAATRTDEIFVVGEDELLWSFAYAAGRFVVAGSYDQGDIEHTYAPVVFTVRDGQRSTIDRVTHHEGSYGFAAVVGEDVWMDDVDTLHRVSPDDAVEEYALDFTIERILSDGERLFLHSYDGVLYEQPL